MYELKDLIKVLKSGNDGKEKTTNKTTNPILLFEPVPA